MAPIEWNTEIFPQGKKSVKQKTCRRVYATGKKGDWQGRLMSKIKNKKG